MAAGDAQRTWFPEMVLMLRQEWKPAMSCVALIELRNRQDAMLQAIRSGRNLSPIMKCPKCHREGRMAPPKVFDRGRVCNVPRFREMKPIPVVYGQTHGRCRPRD